MPEPFPNTLDFGLSFKARTRTALSFLASFSLGEVFCGLLPAVPEPVPVTLVRGGRVLLMGIVLAVPEPGPVTFLRWNPFDRYFPSFQVVDREFPDFEFECRAFGRSHLNIIIMPDFAESREFDVRIKEKKRFLQ